VRRGAARVGAGLLTVTPTARCAFLHIDEVVHSSVEETLNGLLDAEADDIRRVQRYEHSLERVDTRASSTIPLRSRVSL
jgi:hypothetical protein